LEEFCQWLIDDAEGLTIEEQISYKTLIITYNIVEDEGVKKLMGRKSLRPDYDSLAEVIDETFPPEVKIKFVQKLLHADSPEAGAQRILGTDSPEIGAQKILGVDSPEGVVQKVLGASSLDEAIRKLTRAKKRQEKNEK